jgi:Domain of unknown function (DUF4382)
MGTSIRTAVRAAILLATTSGLVACSEPQGSNGAAGNPPQLAQVRLMLRRSGDTSASASAPSSPVADQSRLTVDNVSSLSVTVTSVEFLPADSGSADAWVSLTLDTPATLDLLSLPTADASPIVFASGSVEVGSYRKVRLFVSDAQITFANDVTVGQATFAAGTEYPVTIPSADQSGIKTDATFNIVADESGAVSDVLLLFDPSATFVNATVTGAGGVMLAPVIRTGMGGG